MRLNYRIGLMLAFWGLGGIATAQDSTRVITTPDAIIPGHSDDIEVLASSPDGKWLASGSWDRAIVLYTNDSASTQQAVFKNHNAAISALAFSKDGKYLLSAAGDYTVYVWDIQKKTIAYTLSDARKPILALAMSPDNRFVLVSYKDEGIVIHDLTKTPTKLRVINAGRNVNTLAYISTGKAFFAGLDGGEIRMYSAAGQVLKTLTGHADAVQSVTISPDNRTLFSGSKDKTIRAWDIMTAKETYQLTGHAWSVNSVQVSGDNRYLVSASSDGTTKVWSLESKMVLLSLEGYGFNVTSAVWSPDNRYIFNASMLKANPEYGLRKWSTGLIYELPKKTPPAPPKKPGTPAPKGTPGAKPAPKPAPKPAGKPAGSK